MLNREMAEAFADNWITAWNRHDLNMLATHYTEDFEFSSPFIRALTGVPESTLKGLPAVREYWEKALEAVKEEEVRFELLKVFVGVDSVIIQYKGVAGRMGCQVFFFNKMGAVYKAMSHYDRV